ncbi:MAG: hypothetical protein ACTTHX_05705 [Moraxella sp.]
MSTEHTLHTDSKFGVICRWNVFQKARTRFDAGYYLLPDIPK